jgi:hypothetical protein
MKRILSLVFVLVSVFCYADSVQQGCVKTRGRYISLFIPLEEQRDKYHVASSVPLQRDTVCMPCGENDILIIK